MFLHPWSCLLPPCPCVLFLGSSYSHIGWLLSSWPSSVHLFMIDTTEITQLQNSVMLWCHVPTHTFPSPQSQLGRHHLFLRHFLPNLNLFLLLCILLTVPCDPDIYTSQANHRHIHGPMESLSHIWDFRVLSASSRWGAWVTAVSWGWPRDCGPHSVTSHWCWSFWVWTWASHCRSKNLFVYGQCFLIRLSFSWGRDAFTRFLPEPAQWRQSENTK